MSAINTERAEEIASWRQAEKEGKLEDEIDYPECVSCGNPCQKKDKDDECWDCDCDGECDCDCVNPFFWKLCRDCLEGDTDDDEERDLSVVVPALIPVAVVIDLTEEPVITLAGKAPADLGLNQDVIKWLEYIRKECNEAREENDDADFHWDSNSLPIKTIDGILVDVCIRACNRYVELVITSPHILVRTEGVFDTNELVFNKIYLNHFRIQYKNGEKIKLLDFERAFINMNNVLKELKFDKIQCCFENEQETKNKASFYEQQYKMELAFACVFENNTNLKEHENHCQECSVCYEKTKTLTFCEHSLCVCCWDKLAEVEDEDEGQVRKCPICRETLYM